MFSRAGWGQWWKVSPWWQKVLVGLPLLLIPVGGLVGALAGVGAAAANQAVLRSRLGDGAKVGICLGIIFAALLGFVLLELIVAILIPSR